MAPAIRDGVQSSWINSGRNFSPEAILGRPTQSTFARRRPILVAQPGGPVDDDRRRAEQGKLERDGSRNRHRGFQPPEEELPRLVHQRDRKPRPRDLARDRLPQRRPRHGQGEVEVGKPLKEEARGGEQDRKVRGHFSRPASREQADPALPRGDPEPFRVGRRVEERGDLVEDRMPGEDGVDAARAKELHLEGEQDDRALREPGEGLRPAGTPGPHLRGDVVDHGDPAPRGGPPHPEVEVGEVDEQHRADVRTAHALGGRGKGRTDRRKAPQRFRDADDGDVAVIPQEPHPFRREERASDPLHRDAREPAPERARHPRGVRFPGRLPADEEQGFRHPRNLTSGRRACSRGRTRSGA